MPLPGPKSGEEKQEFVSRCMGNPTMNKEFPDQKQRAAVCYSQWGKKKGAEMDAEQTVSRIAEKITASLGWQVTLVGGHKAVSVNFQRDVSFPAGNLQHITKLFKRYEQSASVVMSKTGALFQIKETFMGTQGSHKSAVKINVSFIVTFHEPSELNSLVAALESNNKVSDVYDWAGR